MNLSIIPSKMHAPVAPCLLIPAQMWTLSGCLALYNRKYVILFIIQLTWIEWSILVLGWELVLSFYTQSVSVIPFEWYIRRSKECPGKYHSSSLEQTAVAWSCLPLWLTGSTHCCQMSTQGTVCTAKWCWGWCCSQLWPAAHVADTLWSIPSGTLQTP